MYTPMNSGGKIPINILLADDDKDDRFFFDLALKELSIATKLVTVEDGEKLMTYLKKNVTNLPQVLFLDLNMPRKNGAECLMEIKKSAGLKELPVIIYSTSLHEDTATALYNAGAHYYVHKITLSELVVILGQVLDTLVETKFVKPGRENFVVNGPAKTNN